jgi:hypothetical protein
VAQQLQLNYRQFPLRFSGIRGDGQRAWDWSLFKTFPVTERVKVQFRAEVYNSFNQPSFNAPNQAPTNAAFGTVTDTQSEARNWQFSLFVSGPQLFHPTTSTLDIGHDILTFTKTTAPPGNNGRDGRLSALASGSCRSGQPAQHPLPGS